MWFPNYGVWVTRYGREIRVEDMGINHVYNTIRMIVRNNRAFAEYFKKEDDWNSAKRLLYEHIENINDNERREFLSTYVNSAVGANDLWIVYKSLT